MGDFGFYLKEGFYHITDWKGYDHILFVMALCLPYLLSDPKAPVSNGSRWKQLLILITAFTVGHSITLALSVFKKLLISSNWIEFLIPVTIMITALENLYRKNATHQQAKMRYAIAILFGLIHGIV